MPRYSQNKNWSFNIDKIFYDHLHILMNPYIIICKVTLAKQKLIE